MSEATLTRTRSVLTRAKTDAGPPLKEIRFGSMVEGTNGRMEVDHRRPHIILSGDQWVELGQPDAITVAVWPGDRQDIFEAEGFPE